MSEYVISTCSTADMPEEFFTQRNIAYACFHFTIDGVEYPDDLGHSIKYDDFYSRIAAGSMPTTSQVNVEQYIELFEPILQAGKDIIHFSLSSGISGTYNSAVIAVNEMQEKYPERKITAIDTLAASSGLGLFVDTVADKRDSGASYEELIDFINTQKRHLHHWFFSTDLSHLKRGGRVSASAAALGSILNICPLMNVDCNGHLTPRFKIRGVKKVKIEMVEMMKKHALDLTNYSGKCFISCSACEKDAREVADMIEATFSNLNGKVQVNSIGTVIGSHTGPGTVALFFWGDERID